VTARADAGGPPRPAIVGAVLGAAIAVAVVLALWRLDEYPCYVDFDTATVGIFVNDLAVHGAFDFSFAGSPTLQDRYRVWWAAAALPLTVPLSWLERLLALPPQRVGTLVRAVASCLSLVGCLLAALAMSDRRPRLAAAGAVALAVSFPGLLLYARTGCLPALWPFLLFWLAVFLVTRYGQTAQPAFLYLLAPVAALAVLGGYPPLLTLPPVMIAALLVHGRLAATLRSVHAYASGLLAGGLLAGAARWLAAEYVGSFPQYLEDLRRFLAHRAGVVSLSRLTDTPLATKLTKLVDQHLLFRRDQLGDWTRPDDLWTVGSLDWVWLLLVPVAVLGLVGGLRQRESGVQLAAVVLAATAALFLTVSFPEGRYLLIVVPCYAVLVVRGIEALAGREALGRAASAVAILAMAFNSAILLRGDYDAFMREKWLPLAPIEEAVSTIAHDPGKAVRYVSFPADQDYTALLYFRLMGGAPGIRWITNREMAAKSDPHNKSAESALLEPAASLDVACAADDSATIAAWRGRGFRPRHPYKARCGGPRFVLLHRQVDALENP
jgi:hypothetical protein